MKIDLTDLSPVKKQMAIEVGLEEVASETDGVLNGYRKKAKIPGFRPGKAPVDIIRNRFAKEIQQDVRERLVSRSFFKAAEEKGLRPLGEPAVEELNHPEGQPLTFTTTFEVLPDFEVKNYKGVEVRRPSARVEETEVDRALEELRQARTRHVVEPERTAAQGDVVVADLEGTPAEGSAFRREHMHIEIGAPNNLPEFNTHFLGVRAGAALEFEVVYPADYQGAELAGKTVPFRATVHEVKRRELPALDDDFAKDLGDFADLAALRARIRVDLEARKKVEVDRALRQSVLDKVLVDNPVVLPDILVEQEVRRRLEDMVRTLIMQGMDPEKAQIDWVEVRKRQDTPARKVVHSRLVLDAVAEAEQIQVDRGALDERIVLEARRIGETPAKLRARLSEHSGMEALRNQMVREKSLDYLTAVANIQTEERGAGETDADSHGGRADEPR